MLNEKMQLTVSIPKSQQIAVGNPTYSVGLMSGLCEGHSSSSTPNSSNHIFMKLAFMHRGWNKKRSLNKLLPQDQQPTIVLNIFICCSINSTLYWKHLILITWWGSHTLLTILYTVYCTILNCPGLFSVYAPPRQFIGIISEGPCTQTCVLLLVWVCESFLKDWNAVF